MYMHSKIYFCSKSKRRYNLPTKAMKIYIKIQLNFTPAMDNLLSTHRFLHLAYLFDIYLKVRLASEICRPFYRGMREPRKRYSGTFISEETRDVAGQTLRRAIRERRDMNKKKRITDTVSQYHFYAVTDTR